MNWEDKISTKKGNCGEEIVRQYLEKKGWIVYKPITNGAHAFDNLCVRNKEHIVIAEIKSKARMNKWNATGFNTKNYNEYLSIYNKYGIEIFIFFVDEYLAKIYGNKLSILMKPYKARDGFYPREIGEVTIFSLEQMKDIHSLSEKEVCELQKYTRRNYAYSF
jgi:hypothetical protein